MIAHIAALVKKDLLIEWRQRYTLNGILIHAVISVFVIFLAIKIINPPTWNALFWIILLFTSVSAIAKSFIAESRGRSLYYYGISNAQSVIISRIIYNTVLMVVIAMLSFVIYIVLLGNMVENTFYYILCILLACIGFSATFTLLSSIASKAGNSNLLMPVLSLPVIIPLLLILIKASKKAMDGIDTSLILPDLFVLFALNAIIIALAYILFPFLWKE